MIKKILDEIASEGGTKAKMSILSSYDGVENLKNVLYMAESGRIKFYLKQIPEYTPNTGHVPGNLEWGLHHLGELSSRRVTGNKAVEYLKNILEAVSPEDAEVLAKVVSKDLKIGMGSTNINKVFPNLIEKTFYMGAESFNTKKVKEIFTNSISTSEPTGVAISEVKADGRFNKAIIQNGGVHLVSRQGEEVLLGEDAKVVKELSEFEDCVLDGEFVIHGVKREISNGLITSIISITKKLATGLEKDRKAADVSKAKMLKRHGLVFEELIDRISYIVWDILDVDDYFRNKCNVIRIKRLNRLLSKVEVLKPEMITVVEFKMVYSYKEAVGHFSEMLERGEEGTVLKSLDGIWKDGKRYNQIKMKIEFNLDLKVVKLNYGNPGTKNEHVISSITCRSSCGALETRAHGIKEDVMAEITENQGDWLGAIIEIKCNGLSSNSSGGHSVLYPAFKTRRDDKSVANSYSECIEIDNGAKGLKSVIEK